jgi:hypothetical protein
MRWREILESVGASDDDLFGPGVGIEKAWHGVARYMSFFPKVYAVLRQSGKIYGELKNRTGRSDPEFSEIVAVATPPELVALSAELKKIAEITEWEYQRQRRVNEDDDIDDDDMFAHRDPRAVRVGNRAVDMTSIELGGVDSRDHPDFSDAYVQAANYRNGTPLSDDELNELTDTLSNSGQLHAMIWDTLNEGNR